MLNKITLNVLFNGDDIFHLLSEFRNVQYYYLTVLFNYF